MKYYLLFFITLLVSCSNPTERERLPQRENSVDKELAIWLEQCDTLLKERELNVNYPIDYTDLEHKEKFYPYFEIEIFPVHLESAGEKK